MDSSAFNSIDYIIISVILISTLFAFLRGFIGSFLSLTGWILSIYLAYLLFPQAKPFIETKVTNPLLVLMFGHSGLLLGFLIVFGFFNLIATTAMKGMTKGIIDRILGAGFGIFRGAMIITFIFTISMSALAILKGSNADDPSSAKDYAPDALKKAQVYPMLLQGQDMMKDFIPNTFYQRIQVVLDSLNKKSQEERFADTMMEKLSKGLSKDQLDQVDKSTEGDQQVMSMEESEAKRLSELLKQYKQSDNKKDKLSQQDVRRVENFINKALKPKDPVDLGGVDSIAAPKATDSVNAQQPSSDEDLLP